MPFYTYLVRDRAGKIIRGRMFAVDGKELRKKLDENDFFLVEYEEKKSATGLLGKDIFSSSPKIKFRDLSVFCWQLYTMLNAGLTLPNSLKVLIDQQKNENFRNVLTDVGRRIEEGQSFSESLREHPKVFSSFFVQMVNAGEVGGVLDDMLRKLAIFYENQDQIRARIQSAMTYPVLLICVSIGVVTFLVTYILPKLAQVFKDMGVHIPIATSILLELGVLLRENWFNFLLGFFVLGFLYRMYNSTVVGRFKIDQIKLGLPIFGDLLKKTIAARFTQTLSTLLSGGIPILTALDVVAETLGNRAVTKAIKDVSTMVGEGKSIAAPLEESQIFPEMVISMIRAGEETGALDKMLDKVAYFYDREVDQAIQSFTKILEPALIVFMTVVIGFIGVSIFSPLADLMRSLHK